MSKFLRLMAPLGLILWFGLSGCTEPNAAHSDEKNGGWLDEDASLGDVENSVDSGLLPDVSQQDASREDAVEPPDVLGPPDGISPDPDAGPEDAGPRDAGPEDIGPADSGSIDPDISSPDIAEPDVLEPGEACSSNSDCGQGVVCCNEGFGGERVCKAADECRFGGFCEDASECGDGEGCCEVRGRNMKLCSERCFDDGGGGGSETSCQSNSDCATLGEVCCPGLVGGGAGGGTCQTSCQLGGGLCTEDSQCSGNDRCCQLMGQGICLSPDLPLPCQ